MRCPGAATGDGKKDGSGGKDGGGGGGGGVSPGSGDGGGGGIRPRLQTAFERDAADPVVETGGVDAP